MTTAGTDTPHREDRKDQPRPGGGPEHMRQMSLARSRTARERRIAELIEGAPAFTSEQRAKLITLLNANAEKAGA